MLGLERGFGLVYRTVRPKRRNLIYYQRHYFWSEDRYYVKNRLTRYPPFGLPVLKASQFRQCEVVKPESH